MVKVSKPLIGIILIVLLVAANGFLIYHYNSETQKDYDFGVMKIPKADLDALEKVSLKDDYGRFRVCDLNNNCVLVGRVIDG